MAWVRFVCEFFAVDVPRRHAEDAIAFERESLGQIERRRDDNVVANAAGDCVFSDSGEKDRRS